ncbi:MAG: DUF488 family protein [Pseudomonadota bacterium]
MAVRVVRLGSPRADDEGLRIGTVRRPPRGVPKAEFASRDLYDVWFPNLAPSEALLKDFFPLADEAAWKQFKRRYLAQMKAPDQRREIALLAALSQHTNFSVGCYCEDASRCHRSLLEELLRKEGARFAPA